jgi:hypothetical protein
MQVQESGATVRRMLQLMRDAAFLDDRSDVLRGLFITFNHPHEIFCTVELQVVKGRNGAFKGQVLLIVHDSISTVMLLCGAEPTYDWEFSIYAYIVYLSYNIRFFVYFS